MQTYLTIMITILVISQVIRIIQNSISLYRQNEMLKGDLDGLGDITKEDLIKKRYNEDMFYMILPMLKTVLERELEDEE